MNNSGEDIWNLNSELLSLDLTIFKSDVVVAHRERLCSQLALFNPKHVHYTQISVTILAAN